MTRAVIMASAAFALAGLVPREAHAYKLRGAKWAANTQSIYIDNAISTTVRNVILTAIARWNASAVNFTIAALPDPTPALEANKNEIVLSSTIADPAVTMTRKSGTTILESDITFRTKDPDGNKDWSYSSNISEWDEYLGDKRQFEALVLHELGHFMGLLDEGDKHTIMGDPFDNISVNGTAGYSDIGADAVYGLAANYYGFRTVRDVSVQAWKWWDPDNANPTYGDSERTWVLDRGALQVRPWTKPSGHKERRYEVWQGQAIQAELVYQNESSSTQTITSKIYLSDDRTIGNAGDTLLQTSSFSLTRGSVVPTRHNLTIPANATLGDKYLGANISISGTEANVYNNAAYIAIKVVDDCDDCVCTSANKCTANRGDCSSTTCAPGFQCYEDSGDIWGMRETFDVCAQASAVDFCTVDLPCPATFGQCDKNSECQSGVCRTNKYCQ